MEQWDVLRAPPGGPEGSQQRRGTRGGRPTGRGPSSSLKRAPPAGVAGCSEPGQTGHDAPAHPTAPFREGRPEEHGAGQSRSGGTPQSSEPPIASVLIGCELYHTSGNITQLSPQTTKGKRHTWMEEKAGFQIHKMPQVGPVCC